MYSPEKDVYTRSVFVRWGAGVWRGGTGEGVHPPPLFDGAGGYLSLERFWQYDINAYNIGCLSDVRHCNHRC